MEFEIYLVITITLILSLTLFYQRSKISIKSNIDGRYYTVKNNNVKQQSAELLATINQGLLKLIERVNVSQIEPSYAKNLQKFDPDVLHENIVNFDTTYTLDKGKFMAFCLGPRNSNEPRLYDINLMMYVAIHELAHIASDSIGHTDEFKRNFADLLQKAIDIGVYKYVDYSKEPVDYCGINLTRNILTK